MSQNTTKNSRTPSISVIIIALLLLIILLLPPISLWDRVLGLGYEMVQPSGGTVQTTDEAQLTIPPAAIAGPTWLQFEAVPATTFLTNAENQAAKNVPESLTPSSPFYQIQQRGAEPVAAELILPLPAATDDPAMLDLYGWDGTAWHWVPSQPDLRSDQIKADLASLPEVVVLMEHQAPGLQMTTDYSPETEIPAEALANLTQLAPTGLIVAEDGEIEGEAAALAESDLRQIVVLRNWTGETAHSVTSLLSDSKIQDAHLQAVVDLLESDEYVGIEIDYRDIQPELGSAYTAYLAALREALPADKQLVVRVSQPQALASGAWDTGIYDWGQVGQIAEAISIPLSPATTVEETDAMLAWAVRQIDRRKVQLLVRADSSEVVNGQIRDISTTTALQKFGEVMVSSVTALEPGQAIDLSLGEGQSDLNIQVDQTNNTYSVAYFDEQNQARTIYFGNAAALLPALELATAHNLRGVAIQTEAGGPQLWELVASLSGPVPATLDSEYSVAWRVEDEAGEMLSEELVDLSQPDYQWVAPEDGGEFSVEASILSNQFDSEIPQGSIALQVNTPTATPSPTPTITPSPTPTNTPPPTATRRPTNTPTPSPTPEPVQAAAAPAQPQAVAIAAGPANVPFGYGIQVDPRGDLAANVGHIQNLGFNWVKFQMPWKDVESAPGDFSWGMWDQLMDVYSANGIQVLLSIPKAPDWARPADDDKSVEGPPQDAGLYAGFVAQVAARYAGRAQAIEVWNEQNLWYEAGGAGRINAGAYVQLLQLSYNAIKGANPDMIVVSGALTPAGNVGNLAMDDIDYLNQMYGNGAKGFFDALGAHPSGYNCPANGDWRTVEDPTAFSFRGPFENRHHSWCFRGTMEGYREVMVANGDGGRAIMPTEFGWAVSANPQIGYEYARDNTYEEQAQWIAEAYQLAKGWGWVGPMFLWNLDYGATAPGTELANFGILNTPAYGVLKEMPK